MDPHPLSTMRWLATAKDWQCHKELIIRLYKDNDWTLEQSHEVHGRAVRTSCYVSTARPSQGQMFGPLLALTR